MASELEFVQTEALITELLGRFDHVVFSGMFLPENARYSITRRWKGNSITCTGLCQELSLAVLDDFAVESMRDEATDIDDE